MNLILGAGLAGLSCSHYLGHENCQILERKGHAYGHIHSEKINGFTWDEGPHVSFTKHSLVRELFADSVDGEFDEYPVKTGNYFRGSWIDHPAQSNLYQLPDPLRGECLASFLGSRVENDAPPANYQEWLERAFGPVFANTFPAAYTRKYWTRDPRDLTTDWVGGRVFQPNVEDVVAGSQGPLDRQTHYITHVRYPRRGGYQAFAQKLATGARIHYGAEVKRIDLRGRRVRTADGRVWTYKRLINTLPLPVFIAACNEVPFKVQEAARTLSCSHVLLVNAVAAHPTRRKENWMYVYDEDKLSTRINCTEKMTPGNAPEGHTGVQVEVYGSRHRPLDDDPTTIAARVIAELREMGLLDENVDVHAHTHFIPWANVIFDHAARHCLDEVWNWLEEFGLARETDDLNPLTRWDANSTPPAGTSLVMAGRFGQWKYFWTDDCILRGRQVGNR